MKLKLLSTGIVTLTLLPITTAAISQTASAATVNTPVATTQTVKQSTFVIYNVSGQATTKRTAHAYAPDDITGSISVSPDRIILANTTFSFDKITIVQGHTFYHVVGALGSDSWIDSDDCY